MPNAISNPETAPFQLPSSQVKYSYIFCSTVSSARGLPPRRTHSSKFVAESQLEPVTQRTRVRVIITLQRVALRDGTDRNANHASVLVGLEAEPEIAGVFRVDAEGVGREVGIGVDVGVEPFFWSRSAIVN